MNKIPIIDFSPVLGTLYSIDNKDWKNVATKIREVLGTIGFMQITNHGVPSEIISKAFEINQKFFELPDDLKLKYKRPEKFEIDSYYGYTNPGKESFGTHMELRESYHWIEGRGVYPEEIIPDFDSNVGQLNEYFKTIAKTLLRLFAIGLELDVDFFLEKNKHWDDPLKVRGLENIRLIHYPKVSPEMEVVAAKKAIRIGEHTDYLSITLLLQDEACGLEAKDLEGNWIPVTPQKDAIVVNLGDLMEHWTSGILRAAPHRVIIDDTELNREIPRARYTIGFFSGPDTLETLIPVEVKRTEEEEERFKKFGKKPSTSPLNAYEHCIFRGKSAYKIIPDANGE